MEKKKNKLIDWKDRLKDRHMLSVVVVFMCIIIAMGLYIYKKQTDYRQAMENQYNMAFFELVDYVQNVETLLAKSLISKEPESSAQTLTEVWREANLAQAYLAQIPISSQDLSNASKFLNQVSDYSYSLSRKSIYKEPLTDDELKNLKTLYDNSIELEGTLNQLSAELNEGRIKWGELTQKGTFAFAQQVSNISKDSFSNIDKNLAEYAGLIYDGPFSEPSTSTEKKGLTGDDIDEDKAKQIAIDFIGNDKIDEITSNGLIEGDIESYDFSVKMKNSDKNNPAIISISKKGGHVISYDFNRDVGAEVISQDDANKIGIDFLNSKNFPDMKETYFMKQSGILTVNYAYKQDNTIVYPDLVKVKIALDNGEILGFESTRYLNSHINRDIATPKISMEEAKKNLNLDLEISSEGLAIIPTEWNTEIFCYEFKGKLGGNEFLVYINAENGIQEDILMILDTPGGTLTM